MIRSRGSLATAVLLPIVAAATTWLAMAAWRAFAEAPGGFINPLLLLAIVVAGTGIALRWWRVPAPLVILAQAVASAGARHRARSRSATHRASQRYHRRRRRACGSHHARLW